jgi:hypothetical protein
MVAMTNSKTGVMADVAIGRVCREPAGGLRVAEYMIQPQPGVLLGLALPIIYMVLL